MARELDNIDKRILFELGNNCRIPETHLAKIVGRSKESVRYRIRQLREDGVLKGFTILFNATKIGYQAHKIYLKTREKPSMMKSFLASMRARPDVLWLGVGDGAWNVGLSFFSRDNSAFFNDKNEIFSRFRELVIGEVVGTIVEVDSFGMKMLSGESGHFPYAKVLGVAENNTIDATDEKILNCLLRDNRMSYVDAASAAGSTPAMVRSRVKRLEKDGIIARHTASIDCNRVGYEYYKTFLYFEGLLRKDSIRLFDIARRHPNVVNYLKVLAPWDIELEIMAENYSRYNEIINYFREQFSESLVNVETAVQSVDEVYPARKMPAP